MSRTLLAAVVAIALGAGCGTSSGGGVCGPVVREALDPGSLTHVLPGAPTPSYQTSPPTSGAHQPTPGLTGVQRRPIEPQVQVGLLEQGQVLLQYRSLDPREVQRLNALASPTVVVAPAADLPGDARVVATAWVTKQTCKSVDLDTLRKFAKTRSGKGPGRP